MKIYGIEYEEHPKYRLVKIGNVWTTPEYVEKNHVPPVVSEEREELAAMKIHLLTDMRKELRDFYEDSGA